MVYLVYCLKHLLLLDIPLLYYYINFRLSIIFCLFSGNIYIYLSLDFSLSFSFVTDFELFCCKLFETFVVLSVVILAIKFIIFDIVLLLYYTNVRSSITFCLSSGDIYLSLGISLLLSLVSISKLFCCKMFETSLDLSAILLPNKSAVASAVFRITLF